MINLLSKSGRARHIRCFDWQDHENEIVVRSIHGGHRYVETFEKPEWSFGSKAKNPRLLRREEQEEAVQKGVKEAEAATATPPVAYHVPEDAPAIPPPKVAAPHMETLRDGRVISRHPGDLTKELPGEYNVWAHKNDPPLDEEALFKIKVSTETEFARQEAMRQYNMYRGRREGAFRERQTGMGIGVGVDPSKR